VSRNHLVAEAVRLTLKKRRIVSGILWIRLRCDIGQPGTDVVLALISIGLRHELLEWTRIVGGVVQKPV
jgi:hypothetical protein